MRIITNAGLDEVRDAIKRIYCANLESDFTKRTDEMAKASVDIAYAVGGMKMLDDITNYPIQHLNETLEEKK